MCQHVCIFEPNTSRARRWIRRRRRRSQENRQVRRIGTTLHLPVSCCRDVRRHGKIDDPVFQRFGPPTCRATSGSAREDLAEYYTYISNDMLKSLSVNDLWINFKHVLSTTMEKHIPTKMISLNTNIPWFKQTHKRAARHKRRAYDKAKSTNAPGDLEVYAKLRRSLDRSLRKCRSEHIKAISDNLMTSNSRHF